MNPAREPRWDRDAIRLLAIDGGSGEHRDHRMGQLPELLRAGDLLVVNDAATLPASLPAAIRGDGGELRLLAHVAGTRWRAVLFGAGDWRTRTEHRPPPPPVSAGDAIAVGDVTARVVAVDGARLVEVEFECAEPALWQALYALGRPVQYAHLGDDLPLWSVQTGYASRPWAVEMPSAGRPLSWAVLLELRRRGVAIATLTHAAGLSSTGDPELDARLPLPERYDIPAATGAAVTAARRRGDRVIAVGTTVVRALEGAARAAGSTGRLPAGAGITDLVIDAGTPRLVTDGILSGMHDPSESHFRLLSAFAPRAALLESFDHAVAAGYLGHEFGDATLIAPELFSVSQARSRIAS